MGIDAQMLVKTRMSITPEEVRQMSVAMCEAFGADKFRVFEDLANDDGTIGRHALEIVKVYQQDGDDITPKRGETFIEVHPATRYYGEEYERGDIGFLINVASWLESRISDARIFYGGDSSGVSAEPESKCSRCGKACDESATLCVDCLATAEKVIELMLRLAEASPLRDPTEVTP